MSYENSAENFKFGSECEGQLKMAESGLDRSVPNFSSF